MTRKLKDMTVDELVDRFAEIGIAQDEALLDDEIGKVNSLMRARGKEARLALRRLRPTSEPVDMPMNLLPEWELREFGTKTPNGYFKTDFKLWRTARDCGSKRFPAPPQPGSGKLPTQSKEFAAEMTGNSSLTY